MTFNALLTAALRFQRRHILGRTIAVAADGSFVIAWNSDHVAANGYDIYARRFSAAGVPLGEEFLVNPASVAGVQRSPTVSATPDGRFAIAWNGPDASTNGIYARVYAADGAALTGELSVNSTTSPRACWMPGSRSPSTGWRNEAR